MKTNGTEVTRAPSKGLEDLPCFYEDPRAKTISGCNYPAYCYYQLYMGQQFLCKLRMYSNGNRAYDGNKS